jgi:hypothetical protein
MQRRRRAGQLSAQVHQRLNSYALAASAAGVGMLALAQPAEAKIVYTHTHHTLMNGTPPIPVAGTNVFNLGDKFHISTGPGALRFWILMRAEAQPWSAGRDQFTHCDADKSSGPKIRSRLPRV